MKGGNRADIVGCCLKRSHLWSLFQKFSLDTNLRLLNCGSIGVFDYDQWLLNIGNGCAPSTSLAILPSENAEFIDPDQRVVCIRRMIHWLFEGYLQVSGHSLVFFSSNF